MGDDVGIDGAAASAEEAAMHIVEDYPRRLSPARSGTSLDNREGGTRSWQFLLWILAVILVIGGIFQLFKGQMLWGIVLIVVGLLVGPGGVSLFT